MQFLFGSGNAFATRTDIANATPVQFGILQDVSVDFEFTNKELTGQYQFPVAVARAQGKISGKIKAAQFSANGFNTAFFGSAVTTGSLLVTASEPAVITSSTYTAANAATFATDLGCRYANTGTILTKVASSPTVGQYSVSAGGVYTFASADSTAAITVAYSYTSASNGNSIAIGNPLMGQAPTFKMTLNNLYNSKLWTLTLNQCQASKLSLDFKNEDWTVPEFNYSAFADASNNVGMLSITDP
jgi:hypothetical protein